MSEQLALALELCGKLADAQGREIILPWPAAGGSVAELLRRVAERLPVLAPQLAAGKVGVCVNEAIVRGDARVVPGDLVALFPPVSGG